MTNTNEVVVTEEAKRKFWKAMSRNAGGNDFFAQLRFDRVANELHRQREHGALHPAHPANTLINGMLGHLIALTPYLQRWSRADVQKQMKGGASNSLIDAYNKSGQPYSGDPTKDATVAEFLMVLIATDPEKATNAMLAAVTTLAMAKSHAQTSPANPSTGQQGN